MLHTKKQNLVVRPLDEPVLLKRVRCDVLLSKSDQAKGELRTMLDVAYQSGLTQGAAAIVAALEASVVDGPQGDHPSRGDLESQANSNDTWTKLRNAWNF